MCSVLGCQDPSMGVGGRCLTAATMGLERELTETQPALGPGCASSSIWGSCVGSFERQVHKEVVPTKCQALNEVLRFQLCKVGTVMSISHMKGVRGVEPPGTGEGHGASRPGQSPPAWGSAFSWVGPAPSVYSVLFHWATRKPERPLRAGAWPASHRLL